MAKVFCNDLAISLCSSNYILIVDEGENTGRKDWLMLLKDLLYYWAGGANQDNIHYI